jgi:hypothetical protein
MTNVISNEEYAWKRIERDVASFLKGGPDWEVVSLGVALSCGVPEQAVREVWTKARALRRQEELAS